MTSQRAATTTILFSDLVGSTELMQRAGDEDAQRIFKALWEGKTNPYLRTPT